MVTGLLLLAALATLPSGCSDGTASLAGNGGARATGGRSATGGSEPAGGEETGGAPEAGAPGTNGGSGGSPSAGGGSAQGGLSQGGLGGQLPVVGAGLGDDCSETVLCRPGLECSSGQCAATGSTPLGMPCLIGPECAPGACVNGVCQPVGAGDENEVCATDLDCAEGMRCELLGLSGVCRQAGESDIEGDCASNLDCQQGLYCVANVCSPVPPGATPWQGIDCETVPEGEPTRAYFEVPGADGADEADFFRLPFPNDARLRAGGIDLNGFPTPGNGILGFDPVARYVEALESDREWGTYPTIIYRFSRPVDVESLKQADLVYLLDVTEGTPEYGHTGGWSWVYSGGRTPYLCESWLALQRPLGAPFIPGHVYASFIRNGVLDQDGNAVQRSANLAGVMSDTAPSDPRLAEVHAAYEPLRTYLASVDIPSSDILNATVITAGNVRSTMSALADTVSGLPAPTASDWIKCSDGDPSPCPDHDAALGRDCGAPSARFEEYHALVELPIFQEGEPPYLLPEDGGGVVTDEPVRTEAVCLSLTVPTETMPDTGWPIVIYADGTGGSFRGHIDNGLASVLASVPLDGEDVPFAVLGIDQVAHGPRRGASPIDPNTLFFNFANPWAARGNPLQGAVDQLSLARFAAELDVDVGSDHIAVDPERITFFGHSQGSLEGGLMLPYGDQFKAAVLSGAGASLRESLTTKTSPVNLPAVLPLLLSDPAAGGEVASFHPVLALLQQWIDPADSLNFARAFAREPVAPHVARHVFQTYGLGDTFTPRLTQQTVALAGDFGVVTNSGFTEDMIGLQALLPPPASANMNGVTAALRQYEPPSGVDGHFVVFSVPQASEDAARFLGMAANGEIPEIGE